MNIILFPSCPKLEAERQRHFDESGEITDVFQDYLNLLELLVSSRHNPRMQALLDGLVTRWHNDGTAAASSDGGPSGRGAPTKREKA